MKPVLYKSSTWNDVRNEVEGCLQYLFRSELRHWGTGQFYILTDDDGGFEHSRIGGFTVSDFSQRYRDQIGDRFQGHAPGFFVATSRLGDVTEESFASFLETAVHELAHILEERHPRGHFQTIQDVPVPRKQRRKAPRSIVVLPETEDGKKYGSRLVRWMDQLRNHQQGFIRALVHVEARTRGAGWQPQKHRTTCGFYVPGCFEGYRMILEAETDAYASRSLAGILDHDPPEEFTRGWERLHRPPGQWFLDISKELGAMDAADL